MIFIADIHLGKTNDSIDVEGTPSQTVDIRKRLDFIQAIARMSKQTIVVGGDIFNRMNPTTQVMSVFFDWLSKCSDNDVPVILLAGNHDGGVDWTSMFMVARISMKGITTVTHPSLVEIVEDGFVRVALVIPHVPTNLQEQAEQGHGSVSKWVSTTFPKSDFIITHGMIKDSSYSNDIFFEAGNAMTIDPSAFTNLELMLLGHIHGHIKGKKWAYPGSLTINNFGEVDEAKGYIEVDLKTLKWNWTAYPESDITPWVHVELDFTNKDETSLDESVIKQLVSGAIIKITVLAKAHGVINEAGIRKLFNKYGYVTRFETVVVTAGNKAVKSDVTLSHDQLLVEYVKGAQEHKEVKLLALKLGREIIAGVLE